MEVRGPYERWQATHGRDPPAWADQGFTGIKEHMKQQAAAAKGTSADEVTVYCPLQNLTPRQQMRALLDPQLPGVQVPVGRSWSYKEDQAIPDHTLPRFRGNPKDNCQVISPVPENLRGYWTQAHQGPRWEGDGKGDIRIQEGGLQKVIKGYAALPTRCMATYEYKAPDGLNHGLSALHDEIDKYIVPPMVEHASALLGDFVVLYQEREFHHRRLAQLEQQALEAQNASNAETNVLRAQMLGLRQGIECAHQEKEWLEEQVQVIGAREEKAQNELQSSRETVARLTGEMTLSRKQMGDLEDELACIRKSLRSHIRTESSTSGKMEAANSKTLTSSIAQMTIGVAPPLVATSATCQSAATLVPTAVAAARSQQGMPVGSADTTTTVARSAVQVDTGSPYPAPPPPPGFPHLPTGYPPYWGMYPYPYPQYVPPMPTMPLGGNLATMNATLPTPVTELCPSQASLEPPSDAPGATLEPSPPFKETLGTPASLYEDMPPLEGPEDSDERGEEDVETKGAACIVAPVPKGRGRH